VRAFAAPGTIAFLARGKRCFAQVAGRLLLARPDIGTTVAQEIARNLPY
jgi:hypothetical protein